MEKNSLTERQKSKTPLRPFPNYLTEESKESHIELSKLENTLEQICEGTLNTFSEQESLTYLKTEVQTKQQLINDLNSMQEDLKLTLSTLKAQNNSLHNELNTCRNKNYELDVQLYLLKETIFNKDKEIQKLLFENECHKATENSSKFLIEENLALREEIKANKANFEGKLKNLLRKNEELLKNLKKNNEYIAALKFSRQGKNSDDFLIKKKSKSSEHKFKFSKLQIPADFNTQASPEKKFNLTERITHNSNSIISEILELLGIDSQTKIIPTLAHLKNSHEKEKKYKKFFKKISLVVYDCTPAGFFKNEPNISQVWKWIITLLEEYMKIKQSKNYL